MRGVLAQGRDEVGLADPGFALEEEHPALAGCDRRQDPDELTEFPLPSHQGRGSASGDPAAPRVRPARPLIRCAADHSSNLRRLRGATPRFAAE